MIETETSEPECGTTLTLTTPAEIKAMNEVDTPQQLYTSAAVEIRAAQSDGINAIPFEANAYTGNPMTLEGWKFPTIIDLNGFKAPRQTMPVLRDHAFEKIVGHTTSIAVDPTGVHVTGRISAVGSDAVAVAASAKNGFPWQVSLGSKPAKNGVEHLPEGKSAVVNGRTVEGPMSIVRRATMHEMSFTPLGADSDTAATIAAKRKESNTNMEETITLSEVKGIVDAAVSRAVSEATDVITATQARDIRLTRVCNGRPDILAKAQTENWPVEKAELEVLRASRPRPYLASTGVDGSPDEAEVIEASLCMSAGLGEETLKDQFDEKTIDAAMSKQYRGAGLHTLLYATIAAGGGHCTPGRVTDTTIRTAFECDKTIRASGVSNYSLSGTLSNLANKFVVAGFNAVEDTWSRIAAIGSAKDFKTMSTYRLGGDFEYKQVGADGELQHATMGEDTYTNQVNTYGRIFAVSRKDLINDDLGAIESTARIKLGRGAALSLNKIFWTEFLDNASFFTSGNGNYFSGSATNLSIDSLTTAETKFLNQTDDDGNPISITPKILLIPNALKVLAFSLTRDLEIRDTTASTKYPTGNPFAGNFTPEWSSYLSNATIPGYSSTAWYLLADPKDTGVGVVQIAFLNGQQMPIIETSELDFDQLGIWMRGYHDFGVKKQEYRCGVMSKGAA